MGEPREGALAAIVHPLAAEVLPVDVVGIAQDVEAVGLSQPAEGLEALFGNAAQHAEPRLAYLLIGGVGRTALAAYGVVELGGGYLAAVYLLEDALKLGVLGGEHADGAPELTEGVEASLGVEVADHTAEVEDDIFYGVEKQGEVRLFEV